MIDPVMGGNTTPVSWRGTMIIQVLHCPNCQGTDIVRHGQTRQDKQRYHCREQPVPVAPSYWTIATRVNLLRSNNRLSKWPSMRVVFVTPHVFCTSVRTRS